uniref:Peptidase S1 domain-containing protein n=1 Tax=Panagrolaimus sp. ES5 TaxID=591445 RepID=A0AC34FDN2_9BILA
MIQEDNAPNKSAIQNVNFQSFSLQTKYYFHPSYTPGRNFYYDIAIVEFPEGTDLKIPPVKLASNYVEKEGDMAIAAGYGIYKWQGHLKTGIPETPTVLQNVTVPVHMNCTPSITSKVICTATNERFADSGDSGGPLILQRNGEYYQVGVTSMVFKYPDGKVKNAYARVSDYCDWISFITKGHANCESLPDDPNPQPSKPQNQNEPPNNGKDQPTNPVNSNIASNETKIISAPETAALTGNSNFATFNCLFLFFAFFLFA